MFHCVLAVLLPLACRPQEPSAVAKPAAAADDPVLATVGVREVRWSDLVDEVNRQIPLNYYHRRVPAEKMGEFQRDAFEKIVVKHLIHLDALDAGLQASEAEIRAEFEGALRDAGSQFTSMQPQAKEALFAEVRAAVVRRTLIRKNEELLAARVPKVDEPMVRRIYDERIAEDPTAFMAPKEARFFHIFVAVDPSRVQIDEATKKAKIEAAVAELQQGKPFPDVARAYSEDEFAPAGGDLGYQTDGSFRMKAVNKEAFALAKGETSAVIRSLHGFHVLHCVDVKPTVRHSYEVMRPVIEAWLRDEHLQLARARWLADLRKKYPVTTLRPDLLEARSEAPAEGRASPAGPSAK